MRATIYLHSTVKKPKLLDEVRLSIRRKHYSHRTEQAYIFRVRRFILFHKKRYPETMGESEITAFLTHLAVDRQVSASTRNQALSAILFLYKHVLDRELDRPNDITRAKRPKRLPVVLSQDEVRSLLAVLSGVNGLVCPPYLRNRHAQNGMFATTCQGC